MLVFVIELCKLKYFWNKKITIDGIIAYEILPLLVIFLLGDVQPVHYEPIKILLIAAKIAFLHSGK